MFVVGEDVWDVVYGWRLGRWIRFIVREAYTLGEMLWPDQIHMPKSRTFIRYQMSDDI
jgi:hypothetical protein